MNPNHYEAGTPGGKGGQFKPKNGGFTGTDQTFSKEKDSYESLQSRQDITTYKHYQNTIKNVLQANAVSELSDSARRNMFDVCATSPIFNLLFLDDIASSNGQYLANDEGILEIANDKDDMSGIDFVLQKENGGLSRFDLKANYSSKGKIKLRISQMLQGGNFADDFFIDQRKKTNYYAFLSTDNPPNINSIYNQERMFDAIKNIYSNSSSSEEDKKQELDEWVNEEIVDLVTDAHCNVISRNDLQKNIYNNINLNADELRRKSFEMKEIMEDLQGNYDNINVINKQLGTNYKIQAAKNGRTIVLREALQGSTFPMDIVYRIDISGSVKKTTYLEMDEQFLEQMPENKHYNPFNKKLDKIKKDDNLKSRLLEKFGGKTE